MSSHPPVPTVDVGPALTDAAADLRIAAAKVLRANDRGALTVAAPALYPHQWSWDAAFICVGLAHLSVRRACVELDSLLAGQWRNGMIPHIVFSDDPEAPYFPGPEWWRAHELAAAAPRSPRTSGICQPPMHAIGLAHIVSVARQRGGEDRRIAEDFVRRRWQDLYRWHSWLVSARRDPDTGLLTIVHNWESGLDNSPRWDGPLAAVPIGPVPPYRRRDIGVVGDETQRPTDGEYDRYLTLVEQLKHVGYDDAEVARTASFRVGDVFLTAIFAVACEVLASLAPHPEVNKEVATLARWAEESRAAVIGTVDSVRGLARDWDARARCWIASDTIAGFAPLVCGGLTTAAEQQMLARFDGPDWCGHPQLRVPAPPSTSLSAPVLDRRRYWRGPVWPVMVWLFGWALRRRGFTERADALRQAGLQLVSDRRFAEYYEPVTGEPLGSADQSWTAAVALDWLVG